MNDFSRGLLVLLALVAFQFLSRALRMRRVKGWCEQAQQAMETRDFPAAEKALKQCLEHAPLWVPGRLARAALLAETGQFDEAEKEFVLAANLQPREADGHLHLAVFYAGQHPPKIEPGIEALRKALDCAPNLRGKILHDVRWEPLRQAPQWRALEAGEHEK